MLKLFAVWVVSLFLVGSTVSLEIDKIKDSVKGVMGNIKKELAEAGTYFTKTFTKLQDIVGKNKEVW